MWNFLKSQKNIGVSVLILILLFVLYRSVLVGISYYALFFCILAVVFMPIKRYLDNNFLILLLFSFTYCFLLIIQGGNIPKSLLYFIAPPIFYITGNCLCDKIKHQSAILDFLSLIIFSFALYTYWLCINDIVDNGFINPSRRMGRTGDDDLMAATLYGLNVSLGLSGLAIFLSIKRIHRTLLNYLFLLSFILSLLTVVHLINRTGLIVAVISSIGVFVYQNREYKGKIVFTGIFLLLIFIVIGEDSSASEIVNAYNQRGETENSGGLLEAGGRSWRWIDAMTNLLLHPFGWSSIANYNYVHNLWLDVAMVTGIIPFTFLLWITIRAAKKTLNLYKRYSEDPVIAAIIGLSIAFFLTSFVEPVLEGFDIYFYLMCMLWGIQNRYSILLKQKTL